MSHFLLIAMLIAMGAVLVSLGLGLFSMIKGGEFNKKHGNRLMQIRVFLQGLALALFGLAYLSAQM